MVVTDNFGLLIAGLFRAPTQDPKTIVLKNIAGANINVNVFDQDGGKLFNENSPANGRGKVQVGKGFSPATRQDVNIENPFPDSPESDRIDITFPAGYNFTSNKVTVATQIQPTGGAGAVTEVCYYMFINDNAGVSQTILIFRNILTVPVNFIVGQTINIDSEVFI